MPIACTNALKGKKEELGLQRRNKRDGERVPAANSTCVLHAEVTGHTIKKRWGLD